MNPVPTSTMALPQAPAARVAASLLLATRGQRFATMVFDLAFLYAFAFAVSVGLVLIGLDDLLEPASDLAFGVLLMLAYYVPQEVWDGRTLGKRITGTRVVTAAGGRIGMRHAVVRTLCRFIPFEAMSHFGGAGRPTGWHDRIAGTRVVTLKRI